jgi:hypothetical protein
VEVDPATGAVGQYEVPGTLTITLDSPVIVCLQEVLQCLHVTLLDRDVEVGVRSGLPP